MKKLYYLIVLVLILGLALAGCTFLSNIGQVPTSEQSGITYLTKGSSLGLVVGLWHFDEGSGVAKVADSSGNGNEGNVYDATTGVSGKFGNALNFDGVNNYVDCGNDSSLDITQGTWEAWIKFDALPSVAGHPMNPLAKANQYWIHGSRNDMDSGTTDAIVVKIRVGGTRYCANTSSSFITVGEWYHVAGTYDGETLKLYVNGTLVDSNAVPSGNIDTGTQIMAVGTWSTLVDYFQGTIDEVRIWGEALTAGEIAYNYVLGDLPIDIKPGSDPNSINLKSKGVVPVAILGSADFDVTDVDVTTLVFGPDKAPTAHDLTDPIVYADHLQDVNLDSFTDLVCHFKTQELGLVEGSAEATLTGETNGLPFTGTDSVRIVGK